MPNKYTKKPVIVEAVQWRGENIEEIKNFIDPNPNNGLVEYDVLVFYLDNQPVLYLDVGDWVVKDSKGNFISCTPEIFAETHKQLGISEKETDGHSSACDKISNAVKRLREMKPGQDYATGFEEGRRAAEEVNNDK